VGGKKSRSNPQIDASVASVRSQLPPPEKSQTSAPPPRARSNCPNSMIALPQLRIVHATSRSAVEQNANRILPSSHQACSFGIGLPQSFAVRPPPCPGKSSRQKVFGSTADVHHRCPTNSSPGNGLKLISPPHGFGRRQPYFSGISPTPAFTNPAHRFATGANVPGPAHSPAWRRLLGGPHFLATSPWAMANLRFTHRPGPIQRTPRFSSLPSPSPRTRSGAYPRSPSRNQGSKRPCPHAISETFFLPAPFPLYSYSYYRRPCAKPQNRSPCRAPWPCGSQDPRRRRQHRPTDPLFISRWFSRTSARSRKVLFIPRSTAWNRTAG